MKSDNYVVIQGWMCNELNLKGNDLLVFALIYGFTQDGVTRFRGSRKYICDTFNITLPTVDKALRNLEEYGYIEKSPTKSHSTSVSEYYVPQEIHNIPCKETLQGVVKKLYKPCKETLHNNIDNINREIDRKSNVEFLGSNKSVTHKKESLYSKAIALINNFTDNPEVKKALVGFLDLQLEIYRDNGKMFYINIWKSRLNKLQKDFNEDEWLDIIEYATSKGWQNFYPIPTDKSQDVRKGKAWEDNVVSISITRKEREQEEAEADRLEAKGIKARF